MHWKTAQEQRQAGDGGVITQQHFGTRLRIPKEGVQLLDKRDEVLAKIDIRRPDLESLVEQMLLAQGLPCTGWVPGYERIQSPYNRPEILYAILHTARSLVASGQEELSVAQLQASMGLPERTFTLHALNLIEDARGLIALDETRTTVRLATWRDAMDGSLRLIKNQENRAKGDIIMPGCTLALTESNSLCDWSITATSYGPELVLQQFDEPCLRVTGDASVIESVLQEQKLPNGWAATYGENESEGHRLVQRIVAKVRSETQSA